MNPPSPPENIPILEDVVSLGQSTPPDGDVLNAAQLAHLEQFIQTAVTQAVQHSTQELTAHLKKVLPELLKEINKKA